MRYALQTDALIVAKHLGIANVEFSERLLWAPGNGETRLCLIARHPNRMVLYIDAIEAEWGERGREMLPDIMGQARDFDESKHPRDEHGRFTFSDGGEEDAAGGGKGGARKPDPKREMAKPDYKTAKPVKDKQGRPIVDKDGKAIATNVKGEVLLYHRTSLESAREIMVHGFEGDHEIGFSTHPTGHANKYGRYLVAIAVPPNVVTVTDKFSKGEVYATVHPADIGEDNVIGATDPKHFIDKKGEIVTFHGTAQDAVPSIRANGLVPHKLPGSDRWAELHGMPVDAGYGTEAFDRTISVYLTRNLDEASSFSRLAAEVRKSVPTVLEVHIPGEQLANLKTDQSGMGGMLAFLGPIQPDWIGKEIAPTNELIMGVDNPLTGERIEQGETAAKAAPGSQTIYAIIFCDDVTEMEEDAEAV